MRISGYTSRANGCLAKRGQMLRIARCFLWFLIVAAVVMTTIEARPQGSASAQTSNPPIAGAAASGPAFDVNAAVEAYLAKMPQAERARSNAYFEGGYWLQLWDFLSTVVLMWLLLRFRLSMRMREIAESITRFRTLQTAIYWLQFIIVLTVATFPLTIYEGYLREHTYGFSNQTFGQWVRDPVAMRGV